MKERKREMKEEEIGRNRRKERKMRSCLIICLPLCMYKY